MTLIDRKKRFNDYMAEHSPEHAKTCENGRCACPGTIFYAAVEHARR